MCGEGWGERQHCWMFARFWAWVEREERVGKKRKGGGAGCQVCGPLESADSVGLASCSLEGRTGEKLEKEVEREVGTLGVGLPDALRLTWGAGLPRRP